MHIVNSAYNVTAKIGDIALNALKQPARLVSWFCGKVVSAMKAVTKKLAGTGSQPERSQPPCPPLAQRSVSVKGNDRTNRVNSAACHDSYLSSVDPGSPVNHSGDINIGLMGVSGGGKSSLINFLRDMGANDTGSAEPCVVASQQRNTERYRLKDSAFLCELPEIREDYDSQAFAKRSGLSAYDAVIVVHGDVCLPDQNLARMVKVVKEKGIPIYFVRTKVDNAVDSERQRRQPRSHQYLVKTLKDHTRGLFHTAVGEDFITDNIFVSGHPVHGDPFELPAIKQVVRNVQKRKSDA